MDPSNSRPMSYDSLKILLQHAKPNLRFELSRRIPSIRLTEKAVPLRIDKLTIGILGIEVDDIKYEAHTIRQFPPDLIPSKHLLYETHEGDWDLDEWGFDDFSSETVFTPGDLVLQVEGQEPRRKEQDEEDREAIELDLNFKNWLFAQKPQESLKKPIGYAEVRLAPYKCFENNVPLPFTKMVQVAIRSEKGNLCWRYSGNLKYYEIRKQLMTWLLGNRKPVIHVNHLIVTNGTIARLPQNLRISVKKLQTKTFFSDRLPVDTNTMLSKLEAIIHNQDRPLEVFETETIDVDFEHHMATSANKLIVSGSRSDFPNANRLIRIPNQKTHISSSENLEPATIIQLIEDWIENPREIGKCLSFEGSEKLVRKTMRQIRAAFGGVKAKQSCKIPVNYSSQISVSYASRIIMEWGEDVRLMTIEVEAV